jgi:hypothetical protein
MWRWLEDSEIVHTNAEERDDGERLGLERDLTSKGGFKKAFVRRKEERGEEDQRATEYLNGPASSWAASNERAFRPIDQSQSWRALGTPKRRTYLDDSRCSTHRNEPGPARAQVPMSCSTVPSDQVLLLPALGQRRGLVSGGRCTSHPGTGVCSSFLPCGIFWPAGPHLSARGSQSPIAAHAPMATNW